MSTALTGGRVGVDGLLPCSVGGHRGLLSLRHVETAEHVGLRSDSTVHSESHSLGTFTFLDTRAFFPFASAGQTVSALDLAVERVDVH